MIVAGGGDTAVLSMILRLAFVLAIVADDIIVVVDMFLFVLFVFVLADCKMVFSVVVAIFGHEWLPGRVHP